MRERGLRIHAVPPEAAEHWRRIGERGFQAVLGGLVPEESYRLIADLVAEYNR